MAVKLMRASNFELLRIFAMFLIVIHHYMVHGIQHVLTFDSVVRADWLSGSLINRIVVCFFAPGGAIGVGIFFMISGYFLYGKSPSFKKIKEMVEVIFFYSFLILSVFLLLKFSGLYVFSELGSGLSFVIQMLFPIGKTTWWFFTVWILLYCASDSFNSLFDGLSEKLYLRFLIFFFLFFVFIASVILEPYMSIQRGIFYFLLGRYFRQFPKKQSVVLCFFLSCLCWIFSVCIQFMQMKFMQIYGVDFVCSHHVETVLMGFADGFIAPFCAMFIFLMFKNLHINSSAVINRIATTTFGIYLLHASPFGTDVVWNWVNAWGGYSMKIFPLVALASCIALFVFCSIMDLIRQKIISRLKGGVK